MLGVSSEIINNEISFMLPRLPETVYLFDLANSNQPYYHGASMSRTTALRTWRAIQHLDDKTFDLLKRNCRSMRDVGLDDVFERCSQGDLAVTGEGPTPVLNVLWGY